MEARRLCEETLQRARGLGVMGWARTGEDGVLLHAEGSEESVEELLKFLREAGGGTGELAVEQVRVEGHEQFAIRGVSAGTFVVRQNGGPRPHFELRLEVEGAMRSWTVPKGPTLDPAVRRLAVDAPSRETEENDLEGEVEDGFAIVWDRGSYEQGGRIPWPEALDRGHAVFVLHGEKLRGGFALQRTRGGERAQWLLVKRRDDDARPGSDVVAEMPKSVISQRTLEELA
jgi:DNA ligase D-like protein (predicted 3'-phosphoesterase)